MRWSVLSGGAALLAAAGLLSACAGSGGSAAEQRSHGADLVQRDRRLGRRPATARRWSPSGAPAPSWSPAGHQDRDGWRREDHHRRRSGSDLRRRGRRQGQRHRAARASSRTISAPWWSQVPGKLHRLLRARDARQPRALAPVHGAGLSPAARSRPTSPTYTRAEIEQGALKGKGLEIAWVQDPVACSRSRCRAAAASSWPKAARSPSASTAPTTGPTRRSAACWSRWA